MGHERYTKKERRKKTMLKMHHVCSMIRAVYATVSMLSGLINIDIDSRVDPPRANVQIRARHKARNRGCAGIVFISRRALEVNLSSSDTLCPPFSLLHPSCLPSKSSLRKLVKANFSDPSRCPSPKGWSGKPGRRERKKEEERERENGVRIDTTMELCSRRYTS